MKKPEIVEIMTGIHKGANVVVEWKRFGKLKKTFSDLEGRIYKVVRMVGRIGIEYDHINDVQEKRENGELPIDNAGLRGEQVWEIYPYLILNPKNEKRYLRIYNGTGNSSITAQWFLDDKPIDKETLKGMEILLKSETKDKELEGDCIQVGIENIFRLGKIKTEVDQETEVPAAPAEVPAETVNA